MSKKIVIIILLFALIFAVSYYYLIDANRTATADNTLKSGDAQLISNVIEIEKNLVLAQLRRISFEDFKNNISPLIHSYYRDSYFKELAEIYDGSGNMAVSTQIPLNEYISKVYTSTDEAYKYIYVKIPEEGVVNQVAKMFIFKKDKSEWDVISIKYFVLSNDMKEPKKIVDKFTNFNGTPIEYESKTIIE